MTERACRSRFDRRFSRAARQWGVVSSLAFAAAMPAANVRADDVDPIVGVWVGQVTQGEEPPFEIKMTFVSKNGGVTRYPSYECGGVLSGAKKSTGYEYDEMITWGGLEEDSEDACISGKILVTVKGDKMTFDWNGTHDGEAITASAQLKRESSGARSAKTKK